jgi:hypothetical protein
MSTYHDWLILPEHALHANVPSRPRGSGAHLIQCGTTKLHQPVKPALCFDPQTVTIENVTALEYLWLL